MYKGKTILALIPARGGSRGLPGKNMRPFCGKPLIAWSIEQALASNYIDKVIVSTDSAKIALIARRYGAEVPFMRPKALATDSAKSIDVIMHALNWLEKYDNQKYDLLMLLQPTSPLRTTGDINEALKLFAGKKAEAVVSICEAEHNPLWANTLPKNMRMKGFLNHRIINKNRQELPEFYRLNGAIYLAYPEYLKRRKSFFGDSTYAYIMPKENSVDIDNELDFKLAELLKAKNGKFKRDY